ncbi:MAG: PadR family transcriptional regulator, partial [Sphingomonadaceae bacterium]|nr:PadR family transcriptional regulator [Sphingomonadaceae bacterium]
MKARLLVLGMLHRGDLHPYEMKRRLGAAMVDCYLNVDVGTLYYAIRQLEKDGAIVAVAEERVARGGMRTIYRITDKGRAEFQEGFYRQFEEDGPVSQTLYGALLFLHCVDPARLVEAIKAKIARLEELIGKLGPIREEMAPALATGGQHLLRHIEMQRQLDREWLEDLLAEIEAAGVRDGVPL